MPDNSSSSWRQDWVIDPDPLAAAQARHRPTGFGLTLNRIDGMEVRPGHPPFVAVVYADDSWDIAQRVAAATGQGVNGWIDDKGEQALQLWRELGLDLDPGKSLDGQLLCDVISWRKEWLAGDDAEDLGLPDLVHSSGVAVRYVYTEVDDDGRMGWCATLPAGWQERGEAAKTQQGQSQLKRLSQEAAILWMERGYFDSGPAKVAEPFGDQWRTLWRVEEQLGEQWLTHVSGLAVTPMYGVVEPDGMKAWTLHAQDYGLDFRMRDLVGDKAWQRVHQQAWQLCVELGYVDTDA